MRAIYSYWSWSRLRQLTNTSWSMLRRLSGDDAYDLYIGHMKLAHPSTRPLSQAEFERQRQEQKWSRMSRCC